MLALPLWLNENKLERTQLFYIHLLRRVESAFIYRMTLHSISRGSRCRRSNELHIKQSLV